MKIFRVQGATVIGVCVNIAFVLSNVMYPYMPNVASTIRKQLNLPTFNVTTEKDTYDSDNIKADVYSHPVFFNQFLNFVKEGHNIGKPEPLFKRIMDADVKVWKEKFGGVQDKKPEDAKKDKKGGKDKKAEKKDKPPKEKKPDAKADAKVEIVSEAKKEEQPNP